MADTLRSHDEFIGLKMGDGRVCYCAKSTLTNASGSYFAARFGDDSVIPAGAMTRDGDGTAVYFIGRNGNLFENYILEYLLTSHPGQLPPFHTNPELWRALRREAEFYGLDGLSRFLYVTYSCEPNVQGQGIIHWLGTDKGQDEYQNPHERGALFVGGWIDWPAKRLANAAHRQTPTPYQFNQRSRCALVQYRPPVREYEETDNLELARVFILEARDTCDIIWCDYNLYQPLPVVIDLKSTSVRLTHYSLRYGECTGMSHWNFEASQDGDNWDVLHEARGDTLIREPSNAETQRLMTAIENFSESRNEIPDFLLAHVENNHRGLWAIEPEQSIFYRYFRLIGVGADIDIPEGEGTLCMHCVGLELYGDVHES